MANVYTNILSSTLDAFASIISNNLNNVMKRLTSITIILSLPALVAGIYGMNVDIPYQHTPHAFYIPIILSLIVSVVIAGYFMKKNGSDGHMLTKHQVPVTIHLLSLCYNILTLIQVVWHRPWLYMVNQKISP